MSQKRRDRYLKHVETKKQEVKISDAEKKLLEKFGHEPEEELELTADEATVLEILNKRKTVTMITIEINIGLKPLGKIKTESGIRAILNKLHDKEQVKAVTGGDGQVYWVDVKHFRKKLLGTDKL